MNQSKINTYRVFLIGYMGSGKTTAAKELSNRTGFYLVDMDKEIENAEQSSIRNIFIKYGEHEFRNKESELLDKLCSIRNITDVMAGEKTDTATDTVKVLNKVSKYEKFAQMEYNGIVVSCGGGIILDDLNRKILKNQCTVFLEGNPEALFKRVNGDTNRPFAFMDISDEKERLSRFIELYRKREALYKDTASLTIQIDGKSPGEIADEIITGLKITI